MPLRPDRRYVSWKKLARNSYKLATVYFSRFSRRSSQDYLFAKYHYTYYVYYRIHLFAHIYSRYGLLQPSLKFSIAPRSFLDADTLHFINALMLLLLW